MPLRRFVILQHDHPFPHWDLLLESGEVLESWRLLEQPRANSAVAAERIPDHRRLYLEYEGPVSGNRGFVTQWAAGTFEEICAEPGDRRLRLNGWPVAAEAILSSLPDGSWLWEFA
ncbi:MAG: DNA polymerase ligase N-terminal domain-containing protein [Planctomycetaceae bacterium]